MIQGAIIRRDSDPRKQQPLSGVMVTGLRGTSRVITYSDSSGYFRLAFHGVIWPGQVLDIQFQYPNYEPLDIKIPIRLRSTTRQLVIAAMAPVASPTSPDSARTVSVVSNIRVRYTVNTQSDENIGSAVKTFQVFGSGNIPCNHHAPCSPDGYWKAATGSVELDAGTGNEFRDARASCIAGPCPFTRINSSGFAHGGRVISASATNWSDTATFLLQAEVFHTAIISDVRESYPVVFGRTLNFSLPPAAEGECLQAEIDGVEMVFPLDPDLYMSWATCTARAGSNAAKSSVYECELKPGYRF
jgi:hypothetical protein